MPNKKPALLHDPAAQAASFNKQTKLTKHSCGRDSVQELRSLFAVLGSKEGIQSVLDLASEAVRLLEECSAFAVTLFFYWILRFALDDKGVPRLIQTVSIGHLLTNYGYPRYPRRCCGACAVRHRAHQAVSAKGRAPRYSWPNLRFLHLHLGLDECEYSRHQKHDVNLDRLDRDRHNPQPSRRWNRAKPKGHSSVTSDQGMQAAALQRPRRVRFLPRLAWMKELERVKAHGRDGNEDSRRRCDDGSRCCRKNMLRALRAVECKSEIYFGICTRTVALLGSVYGSRHSGRLDSQGM